MLAFLKEQKTMEILFLTLMLSVPFYILERMTGWTDIHRVRRSVLGNICISMSISLPISWLLSFVTPQIYKNFIETNSKVIFTINVFTFLFLIILAVVLFLCLLLLIYLTVKEIREDRAEFRSTKK